MLNRIFLTKHSVIVKNNDEKYYLAINHHTNFFKKTSFHYLNKIYMLKIVYIN